MTEIVMLPTLAEKSAMLREPFPASLVGKLPRAGITLDYVGHGAVTSRLLEVDPEWTWEPLAFDEQGLPQFTYDASGHPIALWIRLTVNDVTRIGCGTCKGNQFDAEKVLIGDAIRNAAMRFGVALDLWIKGHAEDDELHATSGEVQRPAPPIPGFRASLMAAIEKLNDAERDALRVWVAEQGLPDRPSMMDAAQANKVCEYIVHGLPATEPTEVAP